MTRTQIEAWALGAIENALAGRHTEDSGVELKSDWPKDHARAARQIAAHANAAHGEPILWIVGVDERARCLADPTVIEIADWWAQVRKCFCEVIPELTHVNVRISDKAVCALCFLTDRAPYVVRHAGGDDKSFDVPWREGNGTRSATRGELPLVMELGRPGYHGVFGSRSTFRPRPTPIWRSRHAGAVAPSTYRRGIGQITPTSFWRTSTCRLPPLVPSRSVARANPTKRAFGKGLTKSS